MSLLSHAQMPDMPPKTTRKHQTPDFMTCPYPTEAECTRIISHVERLPGVQPDTPRCIARLLAYRAVRTRARFPRGASAAVLVPLFVGRSGEVYVVLSRRSDKLRAFAGDTALPGGRVDVSDRTVEDTARREAFEEIGLPRDRAQVPLLCVLAPYLAKGEIVVTPVVVLVLAHDLQPKLNASEVTSIFAQPLSAFLSSTPHLPGGRRADPRDPYHSWTEMAWGGRGVVRLHRFLTGREAEGVKPVFGITAAMLIATATIGYGRVPDFEVQPRGAPTMARQVAYALLTPGNPIRVACEREGVDADETAAQVLRPPSWANAARMREWVEIGTEWKALLEGGVSGKSGDGKTETEECDPDLAQLWAFLDAMRATVDAQMKELKGDEKKLAEARKVYPRITKEMKKRIDQLRGEDGKLDPKALVSLISKETREGLKRTTKKEADVQRETKEHNGNPAQTTARRRDVKL